MCCLGMFRDNLSPINLAPKKTNAFPCGQAKGFWLCNWMRRMIFATWIFWWARVDGGRSIWVESSFSYSIYHFHYIIASALGYCAHADSSISVWKVDASEASGLNGSPGIQEWYGAHMILKKSTTPLLERWPCRSTSWHQGGCRLGGASAHCYRGAQDVLQHVSVLQRCFDVWRLDLMEQ